MTTATKSQEIPAWVSPARRLLLEGLFRAQKTHENLVFEAKLGRDVQPALKIMEARIGRIKAQLHHTPMTPREAVEMRREACRRLGITRYDTTDAS